MGPQNAEIWAAMCEMHEAGEGIDLTTLGAKLASRNTLESVGGYAYLTKCESGVVTAAYTEHYAQIVRRASKTREQVRYLQAAVIAAQEPEYDPDEAAGAIIAHLTQETDAHEIVTVTDVVLDLLHHHGERRDPIRTGVPGLDQWLSWLDEDGVMQISAPPGKGKTTLGMQMLVTEARSGGYVLMFSAEMGRNRIGKRILRSHGSPDLRTNPHTWQEDEHRAFANAIDSTAKWSNRYWIDDTSNIPIDLLVARARMVDRRVRSMQREAGEAERGLSLILVDYLQTLQPSRGDKPDSLEQQVTQAGARLTALAHSINTRIVIITSLSNDGKTRYSGAVDFQVDCRVVLDKADDSDLVEARVVKARDGEEGTVRLKFDGSMYSFEDYDAVPVPSDRDVPPERRRSGRGRGYQD